MLKVLSNHFKILVMAIVLIALPVATSATERLTSVLIFPIRVSGVSLSNSQNVEIRNYLGTRLTMEGIYMVMPESQIKKDLGDAKLESYKECYEDACRIELGGALFADKSLSVDVVAEKKRCRVTANIYNIKQEVAESAADVVTGCTYEDIKVAMISVAAQLSGKKVQSVRSEPADSYQNTFAAAPELGASGSSSVGVDNLPTIKAETGYLSVEGSPKGARVDISGPKEFGEKGKVATALPVRPAQVPAGNYTVKVSWTDYDSEERSVRVYADATEIVKVDLVKSTGEVELSGKPEGAKSHLECQKGFVKDFGLPGSPVKLTVPRGECRLKVDRDGYDGYERSFVVTGGTVDRIFVEMKQAVRKEIISREQGSKQLDYAGGSSLENAVRGGRFTLEQAELMVGEESIEKMALVSQKRQVQVDRLKALLSNPDYRKDPARAPKVIHMLAEAYREESFYQYMKARQVWDSAYELFDAGTLKEMPPEPQEDYVTSLEYYRMILKEFPEYSRFDEVLFYIGKGAMKEGKAKKNITLQKEGVNYLDRLVKNYPESKWLPQAHLAMAEYYFETNKLYYAQVNYEVILTKYPKAQMYNYAQYKLSWVYFNLSEMNKAIEGFKKVVAAVSGKKGKGVIDFRRQALSDLVVCYAEIDNGSQQARNYFKSVLDTSEAEKLSNQVVVLIRELNLD